MTGVPNLFASMCQFFRKKVQSGHICVPINNLLYRGGGVPNLRNNTSGVFEKNLRIFTMLLLDSHKSMSRNLWTQFWATLSLPINFNFGIFSKDRWQWNILWDSSWYPHYDSKDERFFFIRLERLKKRSEWYSKHFL